MVEAEGVRLPVLSLFERAEMLLATRFIDCVLVFNPTDNRTLEIIDPESIYAQSDVFSKTRAFVNELINYNVVNTDVFIDSYGTDLLINRILKGKWDNFNDANDENVHLNKDNNLEDFLTDCKNNNKKIVTTNGSFDLLHPGHMRYLSRAKSHGDRLIVLLNDDNSIKNQKGNTRPLFSQFQRKMFIESLQFVDHVYPFEGDKPLYMIERIKPDWHIKGGSVIENRITEERNIVEKYGGKFKQLELEIQYSTTKLIDVINNN